MILLSFPQKIPKRGIPLEETIFLPLKSHLLVGEQSPKDMGDLKVLKAIVVNGSRLIH